MIASSNDNNNDDIDDDDIKMIRKVVLQRYSDSNNTAIAMDTTHRLQQNASLFPTAVPYCLHSDKEKLPMNTEQRISTAACERD